MSQPPPLPADYYRHNFLHLIDFVADRYWSLLPAVEREYYQSIKRVPVASQQLYIRLLSRKGDLFLRSKLHYAEIGDLDKAALPLTREGLLTLAPPVPLAELLPLFNRAELASKLAGHLTLSPNGRRRSELNNDLLARDTPHQRHIADCLLQGETLWRCQHKASFTCFQLCFFGNLRQSLTDYVLRDLGMAQYEQYPLECDHLPFQSQHQIGQYLSYYRLLEQLDDDPQDDPLTLVDLWRKLPSPAADDKPLRRRVQRTTNTLARQLERLSAPEQALTLYRGNPRPPARERSARILMQRGELAQSLELCEAMARQPINEAERVFAEEFSARHARKHGITWPQPERYTPPQRELCLPNAGTRVERAVADYYRREGDCYYVENSLYNGMLGLFIWDILFAPVRGAFFNPFQSAPADFREPGFVSNRQALIDQRLAELDVPGALATRVRSHWQGKYGLQNPLVHWQGLSEALIERALARIPAAHWKPLFTRLLADLGNHRSGLPDLILFPRHSGYRLIEVKAPGDRLQKNQQRWMRYFNAHHIPHRVINVIWLPE